MRLQQTNKICFQFKRIKKKREFEKARLFFNRFVLTQSALQVFYKHRKIYWCTSSRATSALSFVGQHSSLSYRRLVPLYPSLNIAMSSHLMETRIDRHLPHQLGQSTLVNNLKHKKDDYNCMYKIDNTIINIMCCNRSIFQWKAVQMIVYNILIIMFYMEIMFYTRHLMIK